MLTMVIPMRSRFVKKVPVLDSSNAVVDSVVDGLDGIRMGCRCKQTFRLYTRGGGSKLTMNVAHLLACPCNGLQLL